MQRSIISIGAAVLLGLGLVACSEDETTLDVVLSEWIVDPAESSIAAGETVLVADNQGGEMHELVVVKGTAADLPLDDDGAVDEDAIAAGDMLGEIEDVEARSKQESTFTFDAPGTYVLFCNIVEEEDDGSIESHFAEGMVAEITVTE